MYSICMYVARRGSLTFAVSFAKRERFAVRLLPLPSTVCCMQWPQGLYVWWRIHLKLYETGRYSLGLPQPPIGQFPTSCNEYFKVARASGPGTVARVGEFPGLGFGRNARA